MTEINVLMVAEKPSIAVTLAAALNQSGTSQKRKGVSPSSPVHEYTGVFKGYTARYKVTATTGHIYSLDFGAESNDWNKVSPIDLFHAPTVRMYDERARMPEHIAEEAKRVDVLVLWLDCDREGENICFEVMELALPQMSRRQNWPGAYEGCVYRAHFSSLSAVDLQQAMATLGQPDIHQAHSVDARQEIDLRLGVAFSRLQTHYFRTHFGNQLGKKMVTYGPCQFPTLWFCVHRHCQIEAFEPIPFWRLCLHIELDGHILTCAYKNGELWDNADARRKVEMLNGAGAVGVIRSVRSWRSKYERPLPLNTVSMLKKASEELGIGPGDTMHLAEQLYLKGVLSYPRTETDKYSENFDLQGTVSLLCGSNQPWSAYARNLLANGITEPREDGYDAGDHPPITPVKLASVSQCGGEAGYALYSAICSHFLSTVSPDCILQEAELVVESAGELFATRSSRCLAKGWLDVDARDDDDINQGSLDLKSIVGKEGSTVSIVEVKLTEHKTEPPGHLSESELLALMDCHGIGTDASMAQHISNVQKRSYVVLDENTRQMAPSELGLALAHGYALVDISLLLPTVRARIENACADVARGRMRKDVVIERTIRIFKQKMYSFAQRIDRLPLMLAVAFMQRRGDGTVAGDAAGETLRLWENAKQKHLEITLEQLLTEKDSVELDDSDSASDISSGIINVDARTDEVKRVQQVLQELGLGSPDPAPKVKGKAPEPKAKGKAKSKGNNEGSSRPNGKSNKHGPQSNENTQAVAAAQPPEQAPWRQTQQHQNWQTQWSQQQRQQEQYYWQAQGYGPYHQQGYGPSQTGQGYLNMQTGGYW